MLDDANDNIATFRNHEKEIPAMSYYDRFGGELERQLDLERVRQGIRDALSAKFTILENIKSEAIKAMVDTSYEQREEILKKPRQWNPTITN